MNNEKTYLLRDYDTPVWSVSERSRKTFTDFRFSTLSILAFGDRTAASFEQTWSTINCTYSSWLTIGSWKGLLRTWRERPEESKGGHQKFFAFFFLTIPRSPSQCWLGFYKRWDMQHSGFSAKEYRLTDKKQTQRVPSEVYCRSQTHPGEYGGVIREVWMKARSWVEQNLSSQVSMTRSELYWERYCNTLKFFLSELKTRN